MRESQKATQRLLLGIVGTETILVVLLMVYDRWEGLGETGRLEGIIATSLGYAFWVDAIDGYAYYLFVAVALLYG